MGISALKIVLRNERKTLEKQEFTHHVSINISEHVQCLKKRIIEGSAGEYQEGI